MELEIDLLEKKKAAIDSDLVYTQAKYDAGMVDEGVMGLSSYGLTRDRARVEVEIAEKRIELYDLQAGAVPPA
jgi:hypothetical protein